MKPLSSETLAELLERSKSAEALLSTSLSIRLSLPVPRVAKAFDAWWQVIVPHMHRIEQLSIDMGTPNTNLWNDEEVHPMLNTPAPSLEQLKIAAPNDRHLVLPVADALHSGQPANLVSLSLHNVRLPDVKVVAWENLTEAVLTLPTMTRQQLRSLLEGSPRLIALSLTVSQYNIDDTSITSISRRLHSLVLHGFVESLGVALADLRHSHIPRVAHKNQQPEVDHFWPAVAKNLRFTHAKIYPYYTLTGSELAHIQYATSDGSIVRETARASPYTLSSQLSSSILSPFFWVHLKFLEIIEEYWPEGNRDSLLDAPRLNTIMIIVSHRSFLPPGVSRTLSTQMSSALSSTPRAWTPLSFLRPDMPPKRLARLACPELKRIIVSTPSRIIAVDELPFHVTTYSRQLERDGCAVSARKLCLLLDRLLLAPIGSVEQSRTARTLQTLEFRGVGVEDRDLLEGRAAAINEVKFGEKIYDFESSALPRMASGAGLLTGFIGPDHPLHTEDIREAP